MVRRATRFSNVTSYPVGGGLLGVLTPVLAIALHHATSAA
jgi:hypothetical protein